MLKVNVDDVAAAKDAMGLMQEELHKATEKRFSLSNENINAGAAVDAELNASRQLFDRTSELSDGVEKYVKNLGEAHDKLAGDISKKRHRSPRVWVVRYRIRPISPMMTRPRLINLQMRRYVFWMLSLVRLHVHGSMQPFWMMGVGRHPRLSRF